MLHGATVVHHLPGRLRVRLPKSNRNPRSLHELREFVEALGGVREVEINPVTGSILVHYHPESHAQMREIMREEDAGADAFVNPPELSEADELAKRIEREAEFLAAHSELALHVVNSVKAVNREVRKATDNMVDLKVLLPAGLAVWAYFKAGLEISTPLWVTLAIFSFNSFVALHTPMMVHVSTHRTEFGR